jgi:hypothetical protein
MLANNPRRISPLASDTLVCARLKIRARLSTICKETLAIDCSNSQGQFFGLDGWLPIWSGIGIGVVIPCISGGIPGKELSFWETTTSQVPFRFAVTNVIIP